jgi:hypothetical protein
MFQSLLKSARDSGNEVIVSFRIPCSDSFPGKIMDVHDDHFTLFHSGHGGGVLWTFAIADIAHCGLILDLPHVEEEEDTSGSDPINPDTIENQSQQEEKPDPRKK